MQYVTPKFNPDELAALRLRHLYESRGFRRVKPGKFEEQALYIENKNFLNSEPVITFMDMSGKLLALKPDVTLSIIKNIPAQPLPTFQKLYYLDEVFRVSRESREYEAREQIGVELVGPRDDFASLEVIDLALRSLAIISDKYVLDISHLGFVSGLLEPLELSLGVKRQLLDALYAKNPHELAAIMDAADVIEAGRNRLMAMTEMHGNMKEALTKAKELIINKEMQIAYDELKTVVDVLSRNGFKDSINLDFSVVNNLDYYNGLIFVGYAEGLPQAILSGGRYDNLMQKMGKNRGAMGFAISLDELGAYLRSGRQYDFDMLILYGDDCDRAQLLHTVDKLVAEGKSVRLERKQADLAGVDFTYAASAYFDKDELLDI